MKFKIFGIKVFISFWFAAVIAVMLFCDRSGLVVPTLCLALLHELAHLAMMKFYGCAPEKITLRPGSIEIRNKKLNCFTNEISILLSGPLLNILWAGGVFLAFKLYVSKTAVLWSAVSLLLGVYNLLPIRGLDGGSILYAVICRKYSTTAAQKALNLCSIVFSVLLIMGSILTIISGDGNASLLIFGCYLLILYAVKR